MMKIGIIGMSPGNAHPYSWASIINGQFNGNVITELGYPAVTGYLEANRETIGVPDVCVSHVWTQDPKISESIAFSSGIENVVDRMEDMIEKVDAVMLMRDDPESHVKMAKPFIDHNVPLFIDKPLAYNKEDLNYFKDEAAKGKFIMSCSSMRYASEVREAKARLYTLGELELAVSIGPKDWPKYGVHMLEAVMTILGDPKPHSVQNVGTENKNIVCILFRNGVRVSLHLFKNIKSNFQISVFGNSNRYYVDIQNSYIMFRNTIIEFIRSIKEEEPRLDFAITENIINILIAAKDSLLRDRKEIFL